jgi:hypothetical protein
MIGEKTVVYAILETIAHDLDKTPKLTTSRQSF